jgi:serine phosphatase RsbU (regulator of sigma subunit)
MLLFPLSFAVAILRYRLWDIDLLINRSLVYGAVTGTLALVYLVLVVLLQSLFRPLAFRFQPEIVTAISTLVIAALFWPVQRRAQAAIDRHFYRRKVDAGRVLAAFNDNLRDEVNPDQIARSLLAAAQETLQPAHLALWVRRDSTGWENGAVAHLLHDAAPLPAPAVTPEDALLRRLRSVPGPLELAELNLDSPTLRSLQGSGVRLAVPLICQAELVAVLNLGLRLNGQGYSTEDFRLLNQLATQAAAALRVAQLARVEHELHVAQLIQQLLLPETGPPCPGWRITTRYVPARAVSGDFFDLVSLPDGRVGVTVGDVTDHGVPAALVMAATRSLLRAASQTCRSPGQVLAQTNELLCPDMLPKMFATCLYAILDPPTGRLQFANAGHCLPLLRGGDGVRELRATGMPLGLLPGMVYEEQEVTLAPGESILLYSDGLVEAHNPSREMFGMGRLQVLLAGAPPPDGTGWIEILMGALRAHIGPGVDQEDDVTLVMLERSPT